MDQQQEIFINKTENSYNQPIRSFRIDETDLFMFFNKKTILTETVISYLLLMLVFTFADLNAELLIYHPGSIFGRCFEIIGTLSMPAVAVFTCMALILTNRRNLRIHPAVIKIKILFHVTPGCIVRHSFYNPTALT